MVSPIHGHSVHIKHWRSAGSAERNRKLWRYYQRRGTGVTHRRYTQGTALGALAIPSAWPDFVQRSFCPGFENVTLVPFGLCLGSGLA
jgi:hypothetical protein